MCKVSWKLSFVCIENQVDAGEYALRNKDFLEEEKLYT